MAQKLLGLIDRPAGIQDIRRVAAYVSPDPAGRRTTVRPETGRTSDDLVPVIDGFGFLTTDDKVKIFNANPAKVIPAPGQDRPIALPIALPAGGTRC